MWGNLRYAWRTLRRRPGHTAAVVLTLALGIGSTVAVYAIGDALHFRPPPYRDPDRLVSLVPVRTNVAADVPRVLTLIDEWRALDVFEGVEGHSWSWMPIDDGAGLTVVEGATVTPGLLPLLGTPPHLGRWPDAENRDEPVVVISHALWQRRYGGGADVLGRTLRVDDVPRIIVGVMPPRFHHPSVSTELWIPARLPVDGRGFSAKARLRDGIGPPSARAGAR